MMNRRMFQLAILLVTVSFALQFVPLAWSQHGSEGRINVTVMDPQSAVVPGATLTLVDLATNNMREAKTSDAGSYTYVNLSIGNYALTIEHAGFAKQRLDVVVQASKTTDVQIRLTIST